MCTFSKLCSFILCCHYCILRYYIVFLYKRIFSVVSFHIENIILSKLLYSCEILFGWHLASMLINENSCQLTEFGILPQKWGILTSNLLILLSHVHYTDTHTHLHTHMRTHFFTCAHASKRTHSQQSSQLPIKLLSGIFINTCSILSYEFIICFDVYDFCLILLFSSPVLQTNSYIVH